MLDIAALSGRYAVRRMTDKDADALFAFCKAHTMFYHYCNAEPSKERVLNDLHITPPGIGPEDKYYVGFFQGDALVAVLDLIDGYPRADVAFIGFFMVSADLEGKGVGTGIIGDVCDALRQTGKTAVRLAIAEDNLQANHFWKKNGFVVRSQVPMDGGWTALVAEKTL
ncbi:MAG: GNAT family N-acetyltransferase [Clostridia bacterium]|nr:GNAT family N-acetyltransferase [Clostridia bacterium]